MSFLHFDFTILPASPAYVGHREFVYYHDGYSISDTRNPNNLPKIDDKFLNLISTEDGSVFDSFLAEMNGRYDQPQPNWGNQLILTKNSSAENNIEICENEMSFRFSLTNLDIQDFFYIANRITKLDVFFIFNDGTVQSIKGPTELFQKLLNSNAFERVSNLD